MPQENLRPRSGTRSEGETNFGVTSLAAPNAASSRVALPHGAAGATRIHRDRSAATRDQSSPMPRPACGPRGFIIQLLTVLINANNLSSTEAVFWQNKAKMHNDFNEPDLSNEAHTCRRR
jgi:hypothetical protein